MPIHPISFSIPERYIVSKIPKKSKRMATVIPGDQSTYVFTTQDSYYGEYQRSIFGKTSKKGGWDCMRHYEILANGCVPWFDNLDKCPSHSLPKFPKDLVKQAMNSSNPEAFIEELLDYTRKYLTTKAMAQYILDKSGCPSPNRVLFLSHNSEPDYLRCLTLIGLKELLGNRCVESLVVPHIYDDFGSANAHYGLGFSYTNVIPASLKPKSVQMAEIEEHAYDLVIYGSLHRGMPFWDLVKKHYKSSEIILLCGEDMDAPSPTKIHICSGAKLSEEGHHVFIREICEPIIIQIGTNNGKDHVRELVRMLPKSKLLLVEPFDIHNPSIKSSYESCNFIIENIAIVSDNRLMVKLYYSEHDGPIDLPEKSFEVASILPSHITKHNYASNTIRHIEVPACTLNDLFLKHKFHKIDYLFLDIEGIDWECLKSIDFNKYDIDNIQVEHLHLNKDLLFIYMNWKGYTASKGLDERGFDTMFKKKTKIYKSPILMICQQIWFILKLMLKKLNW
jgi:FkbM family methyltransferase